MLECHSPFRETFDVWCLVKSVAEKSRVAPTEIISKNEHDVGLSNDSSHRKVAPKVVAINATAENDICCIFIWLHYSLLRLRYFLLFYR